MVESVRPPSEYWLPAGDVDQRVDRLVKQIYSVSRNGVIRIYVFEGNIAVFGRAEVEIALENVKATLAPKVKVMVGPVTIVDDLSDPYSSGVLKLRSRGLIDALYWRPRFGATIGRFRVIGTDQEYDYYEELYAPCMTPFEDRYYARFNHEQGQLAARAATEFFEAQAATLTELPKAYKRPLLVTTEDKLGALVDHIRKHTKLIFEKLDPATLLALPMGQASLAKVSVPRDNPQQG